MGTGWRNAAMALRWTAAGMMEAAKGFRRSKAYKQFPIRRAALVAHAPSTSSPTTLNRTLTSHNVIDGNACFAYFKKTRGNSPMTFHIGLAYAWQRYLNMYRACIMSFKETS